ncbi:MAG TPA: hypothetical protein VEF04_02070, partial [Blastocatellia bacterium]|nr:hypothetical protein [Blastocatellia bacterium]
PLVPTHLARPMMVSKMIHNPDVMQTAATTLGGLAMNSFAAAIVGPTWIVIACSIAGAIAPLAVAAYRIYCMRKLMKALDSNQRLSQGQQRLFDSLIGRE